MIFWSLVSTTQPFLATCGSQSTSGASGSKWSRWIATRSPADRRTPGKIFPPKSRSVKKTDSGGALVHHRLFDQVRLNAIVLREIADFLASIDPLYQRTSRDTRTG